ncbi:hypothetical protein GCM10028802_30840 [Terrabacter terrigena]
MWLLFDEYLAVQTEDPADGPLTSSRHAGPQTPPLNGTHTISGRGCQAVLRKVKVPIRYPQSRELPQTIGIQQRQKPCSTKTCEEMPGPRRTPKAAVAGSNPAGGTSRNQPQLPSISRYQWATPPAVSHGFGKAGLICGQGTGAGQRFGRSGAVEAVQAASYEEICERRGT